MRLKTRMALVAAIMIVTSCRKLENEPLAEEEKPRSTQEFNTVATTHFGGHVTINVLASRTTGCQYLWANGDESGALVARIDRGVQVCGPGRTPTFEMLSRTALGAALNRVDLYVIRDIGTGCRWIWTDADSATDLDPYSDTAGQVCDRMAGRRITPAPTPTKTDD